MRTIFLERFDHWGQLIIIKITFKSFSDVYIDALKQALIFICPQDITLFFLNDRRIKFSIFGYSLDIICRFSSLSYCRLALKSTFCSTGIWFQIISLILLVLKLLIKLHYVMLHYLWTYWKSLFKLRFLKLLNMPILVIYFSCHQLFDTIIGGFTLLITRLRLILC